MAPRKRKATDAPQAPQVVNNTTINNYFAAAPPAAAAPEAAVAEEAPGRWLPPRSADPRVSQTPGGALWIRCLKCRGRKAHGPEQFVPEKNPRDAAAYTKAVEALAEARAAKDGDAFAAARETIATLATTLCAPCRAIQAKSQANPESKKGACREEWERLKAEVFATCRACGAQRAVEADHGDAYAANAKAHTKMVATHGEEAADAAYPAAERKLCRLSATDSYWHCHGGVEAMRAEAAKCAPLCRACHALDPSSNSAPENAGSRAKAEAGEYATNKQRQSAVRQAGYREDKRAYNNTIKREVGACERPECPRDGPSAGRCVAGFEACYDWDHVDPTTKGRGIANIVHDTRSLPTAKRELLAELGLPPDFDVDTDDIPPVAERRCRLLCRNCHITRKDWDAEPSSP